MDRKVKYKTLFVDIKLLGLNVSSRLTSPEYLLQNEVAENKMLWSSEIPEAKINLTNNRDQDTNNISSWETRGIWHEPKCRLLPRLSHYQLKAGYRLVWGRGRTTDLYIPHLQKPPNSTPVSCLSHRLQPQERKQQVRKAENLLCEQSWDFFCTCLTNWVNIKKYSLKNPDASFLVSWMLLTITNNWNEHTNNSSNNSKYLERTYRISNQFSSVQSLSRVQLFATPWITAYQASLSITNSRSLPKFMSIKSVIDGSKSFLSRVYDQEQSFPIGDIWQCLEIFWVDFRH